MEYCSEIDWSSRIIKAFIAPVVFWIATSIIALIIERGWLDSFEVVRKTKNIANMAFRALDLFLSSKEASGQVNVIANSSNKSISISYTSHGRPALINVPYDKQRIAKMQQWKLSVVKADGTVIQITQKPGIPYLCSASELGGERIIAYNRLDDKSLSYGPDIAPMWLDNIVNS